MFNDRDDDLVNGYTILALTGGLYLLKKLATNVLKHHDIKEITYNDWYPMRPWITALNELSDYLGPDIIYQFGQSVPYKALWPQDVDGVHNALRSINKAYHLNHRGKDVGNYEYTELEPNAGKITCESPYPIYFHKGLIQSTIQKYRSNSSGPVNIVISETDADDTTLIVEW